MFHIGIFTEKASLDYYRNAAESTSSPDAKKLYENLAKWEMHHLDELEKIYDILSADWFDQQGFSPAYKNLIKQPINFSAKLHFYYF